MKFLRRLFVAMLAFFLVELYIDSNMLVVTNLVIKDKKVPESFNGYKILHLSDLHNKTFGEKNIKLANKIDELNPDVVVCTGDMVNCNSTNFESFFNLIKLISGKYKIYYIIGNHEQSLKKETQKIITDFLKSNGVIVLDNQKETIEKNGEIINLYGTWCNEKYYSREKQKFTEEIMNKIMENNLINEEEYNILLAHNPNFIDAYSKWGADLTLSGHIHGGMVRLPFIGAIFSPDTVIFPEYSSGIYTVNGKKLIVSRGLGRGVRGFRLFNRPEINLITLESDKGE